MQPGSKIYFLLCDLNGKGSEVKWSFLARRRCLPCGDAIRYVKFHTVTLRKAEALFGVRLDLCDFV